MLNFISDALASSTDAAATGMLPSLGLGSFTPMVLIMLICYFILIRPQIKKQKEQDEMIKSLRRGEKVVTAGGIIGTVQKVEEDTGLVHVEIAPDVRVKIVRSTITDIVSRTQPQDKQTKQKPGKVAEEKEADSAAHEPVQEEKKNP